MDLKSIQIIFCSAVTEKDENDNPERDELVKIMIGGGSLSPEGAVRVYTQDYFARMRDALSKNYEATWLIMGDEEFFEQADDYISKNPSCLSNLTTYGELFPELLACSLELVDASKMAIFERSFWKAFHMSDVSPLKIDEEMITNGEFDLSNFAFIESDMRLDLVWSNREEGSAVLEGYDLFQSSFFIIFKARESVEIRRLSYDVYSFLINLRDCKKIENVNEREILPQTWVEIFNILEFAQIF